MGCVCESCDTAATMAANVVAVAVAVVVDCPRARALARKV